MLTGNSVLMSKCVESSPTAEWKCEKNLLDFFFFKKAFKQDW